ncbi:MAG: hypothetical protein V2G42_09335 [bacterium JZ-2024 1]
MLKKIRQIKLVLILASAITVTSGCNSLGDAFVTPKGGGLLPKIGRPVQGPVVGCVAPAIPGFDGWVDIFRGDSDQVDGTLGPGGTAETNISHATGIVDDGQNHLFIPDNNGGVRKIDLNQTPAVMTTIIDKTTWTNNGGGTYLTGIALLPNGDIVVADSARSVLWRVTQAGQMSLFAGVPDTHGYLDGPAEQAQFDLDDAGLTVGPDGSVYVADGGNCAIRKISNGQVTTVVGGPDTCAGAGLDAQAVTENGKPRRTVRTRRSSYPAAESGVALSNPSGVVVDCNGNLVIADEYQNQIFRFIMTGPNAGTLVLVAGTGTDESVDHEDPLQASFCFPIAVSVDRDNNIIVSDHSCGGTFRRIAAGQNVRGADGTAPNGPVTSPLGPGNPGSPLEYIAFTKDGNPVLVINSQRIALTYFGTPPSGYFPPNTKY